MSEAKKAAGNPTWTPGKSGNPTGKSHTKLLTDQLRALLVQSPQRVRNIADKIITLAEDGDLEASKLILERLEGKVTQTLEVSQSVNFTSEEIDARIVELSRRLSLPVPALSAIDVEAEDVASE